MRIVHVITRLIIGGAQENTLLSCRGQHQRGHDVTLITGPGVGPEGSLLERAQAEGYRVEVLDELVRAIHPLNDLRAYRRLVGRFKEIEPEIVHTHSSKAGILGRYAAHHARVPAIIHTIHGLAFTASKSAVVNDIYKRLERSVAPMTTRIVCVADAMREHSLAARIGTPGQYVTVYSGMETEPFLAAEGQRDAVRRSLGLEPRHVVVGTIARLFHMKGHDDLLSAAPRLCEQFADLRFLWLGDGLLRESFEQRMDAMRLRDRFILTGMVPPARVPELAAAMDILVHPSRREGLARALPQGQLAGCPVIAYDIDGNREGLIDGETGFVVPPFDQEQFIHRLGELVENAPRRREMGQRGRAFAVGRFDAEVMIDALEAVYQDALKAR